MGSSRAHVRCLCPLRGSQAARAIVLGPRTSSLRRRCSAASHPVSPPSHPASPPSPPSGRGACATLSKSTWSAASSAARCATPSAPLPRATAPFHCRPPTHPATHGVWQVKDDSAAHQMDMVFDSLLDKAAEAEGCAGASPVETRPKRRIGRGRPVPGASRGWCGSVRRLQSTSWPQADPASDPACSRPGAARLVCKSEWDYKVI